MKCSMPPARASSTTCWMTGRSTTVSISFGIALVAGRKRVPSPATGNTALRMRLAIWEGCPFLQIPSHYVSASTIIGQGHYLAQNRLICQRYSAEGGDTVILPKSRIRRWAPLAICLALAICLLCLAPAPQTMAQSPSGFRQFVEALWPEAAAQGVSRATFDAAFEGVEADLSLPDLVLPGKAQSEVKGQAEFTQIGRA